MKKQRTLAFAEPKFLHYLVRHKTNRVVAHCLDYDLVAVANDQDEAIRRLNLIVRAHMETSRDRGLIVPLQHRAPDEYWKELASATQPGILTLELHNASQDVTAKIGVLAASEQSPEYALQ